MKTKNAFKGLGLIAAVTFTNSVQAQYQGPSTASSPYAVPLKPFIETTSIATVDNTGATPDDTFPRLGGGAPYGMAGIPDGLGAFDNGNGTFTVLLNHELGNTAGIARAHGSTGAFVSQWVIDKSNLSVVGAKDLITTLKVWDTTNSAYVTANPATNGRIARLCSGDLPAISAFSTGTLGTTERIFMSGEETGAEGRAFGHIVTGPEAGTSYELPRLGKFSWENALAAPFAQNKTVVIGTDDTTPGEVYVYVGTKTNSGSEVDKAGLTNGLLYGIKVGVSAAQAEDVVANAARINNPFGIVKGGTTTFSLVPAPNSGNVANVTGAQLQAAHTTDTVGNGQTDGNDGVTNFLRPEDAAWDTQSNNKCYFATTDRYDGVKDGASAVIGRSRLWVLEFTDITNPQLGGTIKLLLDGSETLANGGLNMMDNIGVDKDGKVTIVEDVGGNAHNGKFARYDPVTGTVEILAKHDPSRNGDIGLAATAPFSQDEEFSGNIDITDVMAGSIINTGSTGERWYLTVDQQHYGISGEKVEGGQIIAIHDISPVNNVAVTRGGIVRDRKTGKYVQTVTIKNNNANALDGSFVLALDGLSPTATLSNSAGVTAAYAPLGSPYITVSGSPLAAGASASVVLQFNNPSNSAINYTSRVLNSIVTP